MGISLAEESKNGQIKLVMKEVLNRAWGMVKEHTLGPMVTNISGNGSLEGLKEKGNSSKETKFFILEIGSMEGKTDWALKN